MEQELRNDLAFGTHLFDDGWAFIKCPLESDMEFVLEQDGFSPVRLPHDWLIYQGTNLYEDSSGWYQKKLVLAGDIWREALFLLRFEGVYMDSTVYINETKAAEWKYGYSTFEVDITPYLEEGENRILVQVKHQAPNSRWYSGAGIYRDVWLKVLHPSYLVSDGSYVTIKQKADDIWTVEVETEVVLNEQKHYHLEYSLHQMDLTAVDGGQELAKIETAGSGGRETVSIEADVRHPLLWDTEHPYRYQLWVSLFCDGRFLQQERYTVGFRTIAFLPDQGFLLNGRKLKLNGVCEHHDLGCLGAAYHSSAMYRKMMILKEMGVNALRLSHNMPAPDVMELADELGILVVSEAFDMWERPKTTYDYGRFFPDWYQKDVASWVRRDRNHPSLIMWSIGNEIYDTHVDERGQVLTQMLADEVRVSDPGEHAPITIGSNYMPWEHAQRCADIIKVAGYNYSENYYRAHHKEHPDWVIYGSETASTVQSRGVYHFPFGQQLLADEDRQCSALGNSTTSWGAKSPEACIIAERDHPFSCGQFLWTGFDYIGEPTPYHTRNSYFGQVDTAGFPKDSYYIYQAEWTDGKTNPMIHIFPYWDFNEGQMIDVRVCSNASRIELFLGEESLGIWEIDHKHGQQLVGHWRIPYRKGILRACAYDEAGNIIAEDIRSSFGEAYELVVKADKAELRGDGRDLVFLEISAIDREGNPVENAANRVMVEVTGAGRLEGLDNGDSTEEDEYKGNSRRLFNGKLLAVISADAAWGEAAVRITSDGLTEASLTIPVLDGGMEQAGDLVEDTTGNSVPTAESVVPTPTEHPVRAIRLYSSCKTALNGECKTAIVTAVIHPAGAEDQEVSWCAVNEKGILSTLAEVKSHGLTAEVTAISDGDFKIRCMSKAGTNHIRVISELDFSVTGMGTAWMNPYSFISAGLYNFSRGEVGNGNEHGIATARDGETQVGFNGIDFGEFGSDEITIPVFALTGEAYPIQLWEGTPGEEGSLLLLEAVYQKPSIWNVYQEETYRLKKRLKGVTGICFVVYQKIHLKGFVFTPMNKAYQKLWAGECDQVYGDSFLRNGEMIREIGNNVTLCYHQMDFGRDGTDTITICGSTSMEKNAIQLRISSEDGERVHMIEFSGADGKEQTFSLSPEYGCCEVCFVFLPGSHFDFQWFCFGRQQKYI